MPHTIVLTDEEARTTGLQLVSLIEQDFMNRRRAIEKVRFVRNVYYGNRRRKLRFKGQSDLHLHVLAEKIESLVPKIMNAFFGTDPHAHAKRVPLEFDAQTTKAVERHMSWVLDNDIPNFYRTFESYIRNHLLDGVSVLKPVYVFEQRDTVDITNVTQFHAAGDKDLNGEEIPETRIKLPVEILGELFTGLVIVQTGDKDGEAALKEAGTEQTLEGMTFLIDFEEDRRPYANILVEFHPSDLQDELEVYTYRPIVVKDHVEVDLIEYEDLIVPFRASDLQSAERVVQQYWLTIPEIEQKVLKEGWNITADDMENLRARGRTERQQEELPTNRSLKRQKDRQIGEFSQRAARAGLKPYESEKVLIFEVYARDDVTGTGNFSEVIYQVPHGLRKIVKAQYLEEVFPHGRRPFAELHAIPISNRYYSQSLGEWLAPINIQVNTILNQVNDAQELINNPFFFYMPLSIPGDPKIMKGLEPGQGIPVSDVNGVLFPRFNQQPLANLSAMDSLLLFADRLTMSPQASGNSQVRNSPRTARGTLALLSEANLKVDAFITAAQKGGWAELMHQIYTLYHKHGSPAMFSTVTGTEKPKVSSKALRDRVEFDFKGNTVNTNKEVMRQIAQTRWALFANDPQYLNDPERRRELARTTLEALGEGIDVDNTLFRIQGQGGQRQPLSQQAETQMMLRGMPITVLPGDDHAAHLADLDRTMRSPQAEEFKEWQVAFLAAHSVEHSQVQQAQAAAAQVQGGSQANNVPEELSDLEGGVTG